MLFEFDGWINSFDLLKMDISELTKEELYLAIEQKLERSLEKANYTEKRWFREMLKLAGKTFDLVFLISDEQRCVYISEGLRLLQKIQNFALEYPPTKTFHPVTSFLKTAPPNPYFWYYIDILVEYYLKTKI